MATLLIHNAHTVATQNDQGEELRETSVLFTVLLGAWFLKEPFTLRRSAGTCIMVAGVMALRMG